MPDNPTTALVKAANSPALARVSNQLALTNKLLTKPEEPLLIPFYDQNWLWGYFDKKKNVVIEPKYNSYAHIFRGRFANVSMEENNVKDSGIINFDGSIVVKLKYQKVQYTDGIFIAQNHTFTQNGWASFSGNHGFLNEYGNEITHMNFDTISQFCENLSCVSINNRYGFLKKRYELRHSIRI